MKAADSLRLDKTTLIVTGISDEAEEMEYWRHKSPLERWQAIEQMRQIVYGYDPLTARLQRVLTVTQLSRR